MGTFRIMGLDIETLPALLIFASVVLIAVLGGVATSPNTAWFQNLRKPSFQPPNWVFGPVWTTLYLLLIISAIIAWNTALPEHRSTIMWLFVINGIFNLAWSFIFFRGHLLLASGLDILAVLITIVLLIVKLWPVSQLSAILLIPYLIWVGFASAVNWAVIKLN